MSSPAESPKIGNSPSSAIAGSRSAGAHHSGPCGEASVQVPASVVSVMPNNRLMRPSSAAAISLCTRSDTGVSASTIAHSRIDDSAGPIGSTDQGPTPCSAAASTSSAA